MKAQAFLELVDKTLTAQQDFFAARRKGAGVITTQDLLIKSKDLEKQCRAVIKEGHLEPDEPTATVHVYTTEAFQQQMNLTEPPADYVTTALSADEERKLRLHLEDERDAGEIGLEDTYAEDGNE
jgi:hypothetical protein